MRTLIDVYSDYGVVGTASSSIDTFGMGKANIIQQIPSNWGTSAGTTHSIEGSLAFRESTEFLCPIDSFIVLPTDVPTGSIYTLEIFNGVTLAYTYSETTTYPNQKIEHIGFTLVVGNKWKLTIVTPISTSIRVSRVLVGKLWEPNLTVVGDITIAKTGFYPGQRLRNGGTFIAPSKNLRTLSVNYQELTEEAMFSLQDALSSYGSGASIFVEGLVNTTAFTMTSIYGRLKEWGKPTRSVSGRYSISLVIEESL